MPTIRWIWVHSVQSIHSRKQARSRLDSEKAGILLISNILCYQKVRSLPQVYRIFPRLSNKESRLRTGKAGLMLLLFQGHHLVDAALMSGFAGEGGGEPLVHNGQ